MIPVLVALLACLWALGSEAEETAVGSETAASRTDNPAETAAQADAAAPGDKEFKPPPGFKTKKRGELVLYCMRDSTVGTRFKTEKCYDEAQMRDYIAAQQENKRDIDRVRNTCSTGLGEYCRRQ
jgi:hypothetical protein